MPEDKLFYKNINISFKTQKNRQCHKILLCKCTLQYIIDKEIGIIFFLIFGLWGLRGCLRCKV